MIVKLGKRHPVYKLYTKSKTGGRRRLLGTHGSMAAAQAQERAIQINHVY